MITIGDPRLDIILIAAAIVCKFGYHSAVPQIVIEAERAEAALRKAGRLP